ncbi:WG repeat-containing protein [Anabaena sp. CCY 9910]|uniref:WG repeat-containing protein n=1 Tax=Anabaena sp. CCY 9910 TaxID=3103870 RepID=UPI0039DFC94B
MIGYILRRRYKIIKQLGSGGFGETYLAEYPQDLPVSPQYKCVVKRLTRPQTPDLDTEERFKREAAILFKLGKEHNQIPELYDFFEENREFYLVQEYIDGHDLSYEIEQGKPWSEADVIQLLQEILEVLDFVHQNNVIHRDIKPLNLMRRYSDNKIVLIDFGIVKEISVLGVNSQGKISSTIPIGTRGYMPSEQLHGHPKLCSDIYAVGMTAIQALTGLPPQELHIDPDTLEVIWREKAQVSNILADILTKMIRYNSNQRYIDAGEVLQDLKKSDLLSLIVTTSRKRIKVNDKYGYIDQMGRVVIPPQFNYAADFSEELAMVKIGNKVGYINKTGQLVIPPQFDVAWSFSEELAVVKIDDKFGYIDKTGQLVIPPQFDKTLSFRESLATVKVSNKYCYINKSGQIIIELEFDEAWSFYEGLARIKMGDKFGYIGKSGQPVISPQFDGAWGFSEELAMVKIGEKFGYIDKTGNLVISPQFDDARGFLEELARVKIDDNWGYIDKTGKLVISPQFDDAGGFLEELSRVKIDDNWGYIDKTGKLVISPRFDDARAFSQGLAWVKIGEQERYIDKTGRFIY